MSVHATNNVECFKHTSLHGAIEQN